MKSKNDLDAVIAKAVRNRDARERDYRAQSLKIHPSSSRRLSYESAEASAEASALAPALLM